MRLVRDTLDQCGKPVREALPGDYGSNKPEHAEASDQPNSAAE